MFDPKPHLIQLPRKVKDRATGSYVTVYDDYLEVKWRLEWFREKYPQGVLETQELCVDLDRGYARYRCVAEDGAGGKATGHGTETVAGFADYAERAETRAVGRALAALGIGTQFVGQDITEGEHVADAPVTPANGSGPTLPRVTIPGVRTGETSGEADTGVILCTGLPPDPEATRLSTDQARELKKLAQTVFGYPAGEQRLRADLGFEPDESLTLRHLAAHVFVKRYEELTDSYRAVLAQEADVP